LSTTENLAVIPEVHEEDNGSSPGHNHHQLSPVKKYNNNSSNLSSHPNKSSKLNLNKQKNDKSGHTSDETRCIFITFVIYMTLQRCIFSFSNCALQCMFGPFLGKAIN